MEEMAKSQSSSTTNSSYDQSIPSSPRSTKFSNPTQLTHHHFYCSEPTSPTKSYTSDSPFLCELEKEQFIIKTTPPPPRPIDDENFEFKTSNTIFSNFEKSLNSHKNHKKLDQDHISFADQLFHNGQILPLKPPPCFQYPSDEVYITKSSSFTCWSFNKNDFDPFVTALEHVKKDERPKKNYKNSPRRRSRSLSPMRTTTTTTTSPLHCGNLNEHSTTWNGSKKPLNNGRHQNSNATEPTHAPKTYSAPTRPVNESKPAESTTLAVFPAGRLVKVISVKKRSKRFNTFKEFLLLRIECLGGKDSMRMT